MSEIKKMSDESVKARPGIKIVGANEISNTDPTVLDKNTKQEQSPVEVRVHEEVVTKDDKTRRPKVPDEIQVRVRQSDNTNWDKVKRLEDE